jgi:hypothetical protein
MRTTGDTIHGKWSQMTDEIDLRSKRALTVMGFCGQCGCLGVLASLSRVLTARDPLFFEAVNSAKVTSLVKDS